MLSFPSQNVPHQVVICDTNSVFISLLCVACKVILHGNTHLSITFLQQQQQQKLKKSHVIEIN